VRTVNDVSYYDDSIATTPGSALAALRSFEQPKVIILGGSDKGAHYEQIVQECKARKATVIAIGQTGAQIAMLCRQMEVAVHEPSGTMSDIVKACHDIAEPGSVVLLSPASASFGMFRNYTDRGEQFVNAVEAL
jgi:UDP-N-acetylmuramoylalanine--D-glutamate ligase